MYTTKLILWTGRKAHRVNRTEKHQHELSTATILKHTELTFFKLNSTISEFGSVAPSEDASHVGGEFADLPRPSAGDDLRNDAAYVFIIVSS